MKKQFLYLSAAALMSVGMVSCIDNDEPESLKMLREAKANEINAQAAERNANAALTNAKAANQDLLNKYQELMNARYELNTQLEIARTEAKDAYDKALNDLALAKAKADAAIYNEERAADAELYLAQKEKAVAEAKAALDFYNNYELKALTAEKKADLAMRIAAADSSVVKNQWDLDYFMANAYQGYSEKMATVEQAYLIAEMKLEQALWTATKTYEAAKKDFIVASYTNQELINIARYDYLGTKDATKLIAALGTLNTKEQVVNTKATALFTAQQDLAVAIAKASRDSLGTGTGTRNAFEDAVIDKRQALDLAQKSVDLAEKALADFKAYKEDDNRDWSVKYNEYAQKEKALEKIEDQYTMQIDSVKELVKAAEAATTAAKEKIQDALKDYNDAKRFHSFEIPAEILDVVMAEQDSWTTDNGETGDGKVEYFSLKNTKYLANEDPIKNSDLNKILDSYLTKINNFIAASFTEETQKQYLAEYAAQEAIFKANYEADKTVFAKACEDYKKAAIAYEYSEDSKVSTLYDRVKAEVEAYRNESDVDKRNPAGLASTLADFYQKRFAFDGFETKAEIAYLDEDSESQTLKIDELRTATTAIKKDTKKAEAFDGYIMAAADADAIIGTEARYATSYKDGTYKAYLDAAEDLFAWNSKGVYDANDDKMVKAADMSRFVELTAAELDYIAGEKPAVVSSNDQTDFEKLASYGSLGKYENAKRQTAKIKEALKEINVEAWQKLYTAIETVMNDNQDEIDKLTAEEHLAYANLDEFYAEENRLKDVQSELEDAQALVTAEKGFNTTLKGTALTLSNYTKATDAEAYEITIKYAEMALEQAIEDAEQSVTDAELALAQAEAELADFEAGVYKADATIRNAEDNVASAQMAYDLAVEEYNIYKEYYEELKAAIDAAKSYEVSL